MGRSRRTHRSRLVARYVISCSIAGNAAARTGRRSCRESFPNGAAMKSPAGCRRSRAAGEGRWFDGKISLGFPPHHRRFIDGESLRRDAAIRAGTPWVCMRKDRASVCRRWLTISRAKVARIFRWVSFGSTVRWTTTLTTRRKLRPPRTFTANHRGHGIFHGHRQCRFVGQRSLRFETLGRHAILSWREPLCFPSLRASAVE